MTDRKILVIGGGAAGMYAAIAAAEHSTNVHLFEKNEKLGKKIFITGKGRCNLTNDCEREALFANVCKNPKFLFSAFGECSPADVMNFFTEEGLKIKTERGNRVFPLSDHSSDVIRTLEKAMIKRGVKVHLKSEVRSICIEENRVSGVILDNGAKIQGDAVIVCTGGCSYASTGSTGDGYRFAEEAGLKVTERFPSLVPLETVEDWPRELMGLSLKNVSVSVVQKKKVLYEEQGEMLFTHFGVSGPLILSASTAITDRFDKGEVTIYIDMKPALDNETLDKRLLREFEEGKNKAFKNILGSLLPAKMVPAFVDLSDIDPDKPVHSVTKQERARLVELFKKIPLHVRCCRDFNEAIITRGGVAVKQINPSTMESKNVKGLFFAGEVLDLDAYTGGFNLQIAWATGRLAGESSVTQE